MYDRILSAFYSTPWAILPEKLFAIQRFLELRAAGREVPPEVVAAAADEGRNRRRLGVGTRGSVAILPVMGTIAQRASSLEMASGGTSAEAIGGALDELVADDSVRAIVLHVDSPGGSVAGLPELADKVYKARSEKKVVALADSLAASAAFWVASQASEFYVAPGGMAGSVGVIAMHQDLSKAEENFGVKTTLVTSSKYKGEGDPSQPLGEEARAHLQDLVGKYHAMFVKALARGRGVSEAKVEKDFGQGRVALAPDAVAAGMADGVATLQQVVARLGGRAAAGRAAARAAAALAGAGLPLPRGVAGA